MVEVPRWGTVIVSALLMISPVLRTRRTANRRVVGLAIMASAPATGQARDARGAVPCLVPATPGDFGALRALDGAPAPSIEAQQRPVARPPGRHTVVCVRVESRSYSGEGAAEVSDASRPSAGARFVALPDVGGVAHAPAAATSGLDRTLRRDSRSRSGDPDTACPCNRTRASRPAALAEARAPVGPTPVPS